MSFRPLYHARRVWGLMASFEHVVLLMSSLSCLLLSGFRYAAVGVFTLKGTKIAGDLYVLTVVKKIALGWNLRASAVFCLW